MKLHEWLFGKFPRLRGWVDIHTAHNYWRWNRKVHACEYSLKAVLCWLFFGKYLKKRDETGIQISQLFWLANKRWLERRVSNADI